MTSRYPKHETRIVEALRASGKVVHHSVKCIPHVRSFMEFMPIEVFPEPQGKMGIVVSINRFSDKPTLPMTIQKKWNVYRQSSVRGVKFVLTGGEAEIIHEYIPQIIDIMELEKDYSEIQGVLPFGVEMSSCKTCFVSENAVNYGVVRV